ncbi:MAG: hypothetical protein RDU01_00720 [Thermodesulfovibrionales bacterium]|nr:hypothetical protein [Thermodesulfovibrionales bacterium]
MIIEIAGVKIHVVSTIPLFLAHQDKAYEEFFKKEASSPDIQVEVNLGDIPNINGLKKFLTPKNLGRCSAMEPTIM